MNTNLKIAGLLLVSTALVTGCGKKKLESLPPVADGTGYGNGTDTSAGTGAIIPSSQEIEWYRILAVMTSGCVCQEFNQIGRAHV